MTNHVRSEYPAFGHGEIEVERGVAVHSIRYLVLWLTTACNLRCSYCYRGEAAVESMPMDVLKSALRLAGVSGLPFHVQLAGGEPTLEPKLIEYAGRSIRDAGWPATIALQTNGTLLDGETIELCRWYSIDVCLSIDGPPAIQEELRGRAKASFRGLHLLAQSGMPVRVTAVLSAANVAHLKELILCLAAFPNVRGVALDPLVRKGNGTAGSVGEPTESAVRAGVTGMLEALTLVNGLRPVPIRWREYDAVGGAMKGSVEKTDYCHACRGESLAVHPDGTVYPCSQTVGDRTREAGTVDLVDWVKLRDSFRGIALRGNCGECPLAGRCPGDCPSRISYSVGRGSSKVVCAVYRTIANWVAEKEIP